MEKDETPNNLDYLIYPFFIMLAMWAVFWYDDQYLMEWYVHGLYPRKVSGLQGILFGSFLHGSLEHLINNSLAVFILSASLFYFYRKLSFPIVLWSLTLPFLFTWFYGRPSFHIGASAYIYALASFLFFSGIWRKNRYLASLSLLVVFLYGSLIWGLFPMEDGVSWEAHLSGGLVGLILSLFYRNKGPQSTQYIWPEEEYEDLLVVDWQEIGEDEPQELPIVYHYKEQEKNRP
jgi:membrane associated rhomboid family serine protease